MGTPLWQYQVEPGDTLAGIADAYDVSGGWQRLCYDIEANRRAIGSDPSMIHPGDTVWIPMD